MRLSWMLHARYTFRAMNNSARLDPFGHSLGHKWAGVASVEANETLDFIAQNEKWRKGEDSNLR